MTITMTPSKLTGQITPPPSKSQAHRAVIAAALTAVHSPVENLAQSQDILATLACMETLTKKESGLPHLNCGESGSTLRFLIPIALALRGGGVFTGHGRLMERPQQPYFDLFEAKNIAYSLKEGVLTVQGNLPAGTYPLTGSVSSQFVTGLLYALPLIEGDSVIQMTSPLESRGYVDMTLEVLRDFGITVTEEGDAFHIPGGQSYQPHPITIESDYSQSGFWYAAKGLGNEVDILGLNPNSAQGDRCILDYYAQLCCSGTVTLDVSQCPDLVPALAVHAALRTGETTQIVNAARLRIKESDRLATVASELNKLGAQVTEGEDFLTITGVAQLTGGQVHSHNDHRIAMMLAVASTRCTEAVTLTGAESVAKSYPNFWDDFRLLGGMTEEVAR